MDNKAFSPGNGIKNKILDALTEKSIFIGYYMLCRYLNGKGYIRYGCNAGYIKGHTNGRDRLSPCPILCKNSKIYYQRVRYWVNKLAKEKKVFLMKIKYNDSQNPNSWCKPHKTYDLFVAISRKRFNKKDRKTRV